MIVLRHPDQLAAHCDQLKTELLIVSLSLVLQQCFRDLSGEETYDPNVHGTIVVAERGDNATLIEKETGCPILSDWFGDSHYGNDDFAPSYDHIEAHLLCYELGFITNDEGYTVLIIVPKLNGIDTSLLKLCREYAQTGSS